jgi:hypothetical protein
VPVKTRPSVQFGTILKECVEVPDALPKNTRELKKLFDLNCARVGDLKPKRRREKTSSWNLFVRQRIDLFERALLIREETMTRSYIVITFVALTILRFSDIEDTRKTT